MDGHNHIEVMLAVTCCDPSQVPVVAETLARIMSGLVLDGHDARLNVWRYNEDDERVGGS